MKERNDIDQLLRASLERFRPSPDPSVKEKFLEEAANARRSKGFFSTYRLWFILAAFWIGVAGLLIFIFFTYPKPIVTTDDPAGQAHVTFADSNPEVSSKKQIAKMTLESSEIQKVEKSDQLTLSTNNEINPSGLKNSTVQLSEENREDDVQDNMIIFHESVSSQQDKLQINNIVEDDISPVDPEGDIILNSTPDFQMIKADSLEEDNFQQTTIMDHVPGDDIDGSDINDLKKRRGHLSYNLYYRPEVLFQIIDNNKLIHGAGGEVQYGFGKTKLSLRTGLGLSFSKGYNEYQIAYNDYLGTYMRLDSVTFSLAPDNFHLESLIHQSEQPAYDTTVEALPSKVYQTYLYLQLPLMVGYDLFGSDQLSVGLRAGPVMSVLLNKNPDPVSYNLGEDLLVGVSQLTPERVVMNVYLTGGLNFKLKGPKRMFVEIEPQVNYYFKAMHQEESGSKQPYSIGLRIAAGVKNDF